MLYLKEMKITTLTIFKAQSLMSGIEMRRDFMCQRGRYVLDSLCEGFTVVCNVGCLGKYLIVLTFTVDNKPVDDLAIFELQGCHVAITC